MGQTEYLHDKGTDKLIADVLAFDPTKVNAGEEDEIPLAILGNGDTATAVVGKPGGAIETQPIYSTELPIQYKLGIKAGFHIAMQKIHRRLNMNDATKIRDAMREQIQQEYGFDVLTMPTASTRKG